MPRSARRALCVSLAALVALSVAPGVSSEPPSPASSLFQYRWQLGSLAGGDDVHTPALHTTSTAQALCTSLPLCRAFTCMGSNTSTVPRMTYFKAGGAANASLTKWSTYTKTSVAGTPAMTIEVGPSSNLTLSLRASAYTVQSLGPTVDPWRQNFSFVRDGSSGLPYQSHLGDITLRLANATDVAGVGVVQGTPVCESAANIWDTFSSAAGIGVQASPLEGSAGVLAAHDISPLLDNSNNLTAFPMKVVRSYEVSSDGRALVIKFNLTLPADYPVPEGVRIGGLGFPMAEGNGHAPSGIETSSWNEAHIGGDHGFVEYVRVVDDEATLLVTAEQGYSAATKFEAWRPMLEDIGPGGWNNEWVVYSAAWAAEWACNRQHPMYDMAESYRKYYPEATRVTPWPCADGQESVPRVAGAQTPWNEPTEKLVRPGETLLLALRVQRAPSGAHALNTSITGPGPRTRNAALESMGSPVMHGIPGYVLSAEMKSAQLLVLPPRGATVQNVTTQSVGAGGGAIRASGRISALAGGRGFVSIPLSAVAGPSRGRVRVVVHYSDRTSSVAHYYVLPSFRTQVQRLGQHMAHVAWLPRDYPDPFGRGAAVLPWDRSANGGKGAHVLNDARAYDVGLSDDAGGGNPLCLASKVHASPSQDEVGRIDEFINFTLYGIKTDTAKPPFKSLQVGGDPSTGCHNATPPPHVDCDGIRMTMFYYARECDLHTYCKRYNCTLPPASLPDAAYPRYDWAWNYTEVDKCSGLSPVHPWCMDERMANATYRSFNYPHHTASYWAMYHVARYYDKLHTYRPWHWYLERAAKTSLRFNQNTGVMDGTVFREVLHALKAEGSLNATIAAWATQLDAHMHARQSRWQRQRFPYGSEFAFDTTGQEEVVIWNMYYGNHTAAKATVDHILSYMRSMPSWAYNGGARAADSGNNGKWMAAQGSGKPDRGQFHYRSGLNMIPLLEWYRAHPDPSEFFLLEVAMGSIAGQLTNIDASGATSMFFHAYPWIMDFDPHSGDYGLGYFGNALQSGAYYVEHPRLGTLCFLCTATNGTVGGAVTLTPEDAYRRRVFVQPLGLYLVAVAGTIAQVEVEMPLRRVSLVFNATEWGETPWSQLRLRATVTAVNSHSTCVVSSAGKHVAPIPTDNTTYAFTPARSTQTKVVVTCS